MLERAKRKLCWTYLEGKGNCSSILVPIQCDICGRKYCNDCSTSFSHDSRILFCDYCVNIKNKPNMWNDLTKVCAECNGRLFILSKDGTCYEHNVRLVG